MEEEIASENCITSKFKGLVTLTLDRVILHTAKIISITTLILTGQRRGETWAIY